MFQDLKKAKQNLDASLHALVTKTYQSHSPEDCEAEWMEFLKQHDAFGKEFNICFVEPEDDEEHQLWVESDDVI